MLTLSANVSAEVVIISHPSKAITLDDGEISRLYLGKSKSLADGSSIVPLNQEESAAITEEFNEKVLKKSASQLKAYWSKLVFTGKGTPPKAIETDDEVINLVKTNPNLIGYIDASKVTADVNVIARF
jgi:ABC-type phosphate transport system substrate-binding protein